MSAAVIHLRDPDLLKVGDALRRSAAKALEIAVQTGTPCYVWEDGRIVDIAAPLQAPRKRLHVHETAPPAGSASE